MILPHIWNTVSTVLSLPGHTLSQSSVDPPLNGPDKAVDDDQSTCVVTKKGVNEYWRIQFNQTLTVKGMLLGLKGGKIYVYI